MAANLKIGIIADDGDAQKKFEGLSTSVDLTAKSVDQLRNIMAKLTVESVKLTSDIGDMVKGSDDWVKATKELAHIQDTLSRTTKQYDNAVQRLGLSYQSGTDALKNYKQELKMLQSQYQKAMAQGQGTGFSAEDMQNFELLTSKIDAVTQKIKELEKEERERAELTAKNNSLAQFQNSIEQANIQNILQKEKALRELGLALQKANLQQQQYNAAAVNSFSSGAVGTATSQQTEYLAQGLLGNTVNQLKSDYAAYYQQLLKVIALYGVESSEAQNLAQKLNGLDSQMKSLSSTTTATTKRIGNLIKNFVSAQMIVWAIRKVILFVIDTLKSSAEAAAEAEETYNLFITTFEDVATTAEKTANRLASSLGMANSTAQEALGTFGDLAAGYGATDKEALEFGETATQVAMDIISYKNISGDTATTLQSIASGLAGNVENFRKLGYVMTQAEVKTKLQKKGLDKLTGSSLQYAQIQARLEILQEKSTKAQGDMVKTLDSTTNVTRRLSEAWLEYKENLGESVNVVLNPIKKAWLEILESINKANKAQEEFNKNGSGNGTYDVANNTRDWGDFQKKIQDTWNGMMVAYSSFRGSDYEANVKKLSDIMLMFNATPEQTIKALTDSGLFSQVDTTLTTIRESLDTFYDEWQAEEDAKEAIEKANDNTLSRINSITSLLDSLSEYTPTGISVQWLSNAKDYVKENGTAGAVVSHGRDFANVDEYVGAAYAEQLNNILSVFPSIEASRFVSALDMALGKTDTLDALKDKLEDAEKIYEALWNDFYSGGLTTSEQLEKALENVKKASKDVNDETARQKRIEAWTSLAGEFSSLSSNPLEWMIKLLAQTEAVQKFGSILTDSILPALNAWLEPLLPMLEMVGSLIQNTVLPALGLLFPAIKQIAYVITWVAGVVNVAIGVISDTVKYIIGTMVYSITETLNRALGWVGVEIDNGWAKDWSEINIGKNLQNRFDEMNKHLAEIDKMSMEIADNTSSDEMDLTVLNNLFESGVISRDEMNALRASYLGQADPGKQTQLLASTAGDYASYLRSGSTQNVSYGDVSIEINSESGDPEKIAKEVARVLEEWQRNGKKSFAVGIA